MKPTCQRENPFLLKRRVYCLVVTEEVVRQMDRVHRLVAWNRMAAGFVFTEVVEPAGQLMNGCRKSKAVPGFST